MLVKNNVKFLKALKIDFWSQNPDFFSDSS